MVLTNGIKLKLEGDEGGSCLAIKLLFLVRNPLIIIISKRKIRTKLDTNKKELQVTSTIIL